MITFVANRIIDAKRIGLLEGQTKYRAYFVATKLYERYRLDVEAILLIEGCGDCIVTK